MTMTAETQSDTTPEHVIASHPATILIAEDDDLLAKNLVTKVEQLGFQAIGPAGDGQQAIDLAKEHRPDLALLDVRMPGKDGLAAATVLFNDLSIPVVIVSAYSDPEYLDATKRIGVFGYVLKPISLDELRVNITIAWGRFLQHVELRKEVQDLKTALEERKIIERAKGLLMDKLGLLESEAMRRLHKQARDSRRRLADMARALLESEELLSNSPKPTKKH